MLPSDGVFHGRNSSFPMAEGIITATAAEALAAERRARTEQREKRRLTWNEQQRLITVSQGGAATKTQQVQDCLRSLETILPRSLGQATSINLASLKRPLPHKPPPAQPPVIETFLPPKPSFLQQLLAWRRRKYKEAIEDAHNCFVAAVADSNANELMRAAEFESAVAETENYNSQIDQWIEALKASDPCAVREYLALVLEKRQFLDDFDVRVDVGILPSSSHLVINYFLPDASIIPDHRSFTYNRSRDVISGKTISPKERKIKYADVLAQSALAVLSIVFRADTRRAIQCITLNGMIDTTDRSTGRDLRVCVFSVRADRDTFEMFNLQRVSAIECLRSLKATISRSPEELSPVKPILELNMTDPRFIESGDVLSTLDQRPNLMDLSPGEFETLITNLFAKMGLETRLTQASRDGGVDCVAYDQRPILGGKVVVQAKRYKNTVGVSSVRDLFGTVQNEGASKGILVTTSGYGKAAFDFAVGKPLELLDGHNLLFLLDEKAGIKAKIVMPEA
jgi:restriction system protein